MTTNAARPVPLMHRKMVPQLSMALQQGNLPFSLTEDEESWSPDEWAWQFLRLNRHYLKDYARAAALRLLRSKNDRRLCEGGDGLDSSYKGRPGITYRDIIEHEKHCRTRYGLSTWLNPGNTRLPQLEDGCSWFFPLRLVTFGNRTLLQSVIKGIFRYYDRPHDIDSAELRSAIRFTVKVDRPVSAQLRSIEYLANRHRQILKQNPKLIVRPDDDTIDEFLACRPIKLTRHRGLSSGRLAEIDVDTCGALRKQLDHYSRALPLFVDQLPTKIKLLERFDLPVRAEKQYETSRDKSRTILSDGHPYKRQIILRQLSDMGLTPAEIVDLVRSHAGIARPKSDPELTYYDQFPARIQKCLGDAKSFVNKAYRWFVYSEYQPTARE